jgi:tripartite-type tricarboxylate transporter receptor subunit TctC
VHALAITGTVRSSLLPDVPTFSEKGFPELALGAWYGLFAPRGAPANAIAELSTAVDRILAEPEFRTSLIRDGVEPTLKIGPAFAAFVDADAKRWMDIVAGSGLAVK